MLREPTRAELPRLLRAENQAAELHKLAVMREATQIARFRQDGEGENRSDARQRAEPLIVRMGIPCLIRRLFDRRSGGTERLLFRKNDPKHLDGLGILRHREAHTLTRRVIEIVEKPVLLTFRPTMVQASCSQASRE